MSHAEDIRRIHEATFHAAADDRVFIVPKQVLPLLRKAGVTVPAPGATYDRAALDKSLSVLTVDERIQCKQVLAHCGLLRV